MTAPLTGSECQEIEGALCRYGIDTVEWHETCFCQSDWRDIMNTVHRLAEMGLGEEFATQMIWCLDPTGEIRKTILPPYTALLTAPIETWGRAILETVRANVKAQET